MIEQLTNEVINGGVYIICIQALPDLKHVVVKMMNLMYHLYGGLALSDQK